MSINDLNWTPSRRSLEHHDHTIALMLNVLDWHRFRSLADDSNEVVIRDLTPAAGRSTSTATFPALTQGYVVSATQAQVAGTASGVVLAQIHTPVSVILLVVSRTPVVGFQQNHILAVPARAVLPRSSRRRHSRTTG